MTLGGYRVFTGDFLGLREEMGGVIKTPPSSSAFIKANPVPPNERFSTGYPRTGGRQMSTRFIHTKDRQVGGRQYAVGEGRWGGALNKAERGRREDR